MPEPVARPSIPGLLPKAALTAARVAHKPAHIPEKMTNSALMTGGATHHFLAGANAAAKDAVAALDPRGPAKLLTNVFEKVDATGAASAAKAAASTQVLWKPLSVASEQLGQALVNPLAHIYAKSAGFEDPTSQDLLAALTHSKGWPVPPPPKEGDGGTEQPKAPDGGGEPPKAPDGGGAQPATPDAGGEQPSSPDGAGEQPPAPDAGGEQPKAPDGAGDQPEAAASTSTSEPAPAAAPEEPAAPAAPAPAGEAQPAGPPAAGTEAAPQPQA